MVSSVHELVHIIDDANDVSFQSNEQKSATESNIIEHRHTHDHGHGHHSHDSYLMLLINSLDYEKIVLVLKDVRNALSWMLHFPEIFREFDSSLDNTYQLTVSGFTVYSRVLNLSMNIDTPTPPPKVFG